MDDVRVGVWIGRGCGRPVGGGCVCVLDTRFAVSEGVDLVIPRACCLVSLLESITLIPRRLHLPSVGSPTSYRLFTPG